MGEIGQDLGISTEAHMYVSRFQSHRRSATQRRSAGAALHRKVDSITIQRKIVAFHGDASASSVNEGSGLLPALRAMTPIALRSS